MKSVDYETGNWRVDLISLALALIVLAAFYGACDKRVDDSTSIHSLDHKTELVLLSPAAER